MLNRREFVASLLPTSAAAVVLDAKDGHVRWMHNAAITERWRVPAGSTIKPFTLLTLLRSGLLRPKEQVLCRRIVRIAGLRLDCSHAAITVPLDVSRVLAYSCNSATAQWSPRLHPGDLASALANFGWHVDASVQPLLQALGERGVTATALEAAHAYRTLSRLTSESAFTPILAGLEGAVDFGTAQNAKAAGLRIAGKTGTVRTDSGMPIACFAGWAPSRAPEVVVAVALQGASGAVAAAPLASQLFGRYRQGEF